MRPQIGFAAFSGILGLAGAANAEIFSAGPAYPGNPFGGTVTCRIFNAGLGAVSITSRQIWDNTGAAHALATDTCNTPLAPTKYCAFTTPADGNFAFICRINSNGSDNNLSGVIDVRGPAGDQVTLPFHK